MDIHACASFFRERDRFLFITHTRPDGDTLGSAAALCHALRRLGKSACLYPNEEITATYLPFVADYLAGDAGTDGIIVSVDVADTTLFPRGFAAPVELALDHHPNGGRFARQHLTEPHRAACGELVLELLEELCGAPDETEAQLLYIAISTDTGCFRYANTTSASLRAAAKLMDAGADAAGINKLLFRTKTRSRLLLEGMIYADLLSYRDDQINIALVTLDKLRRSGATEDDCEDLASLAGQVAGNRVAITVRELAESRCKISLRTDGSVNATEVCARFGGGGHRMASGCELDMTPEDAAEVLRLAVEDVWP